MVMGRCVPRWVLVGCQQSEYVEWGEEVMARYRIHFDVTKQDRVGSTSIQTWPTRKGALAALTHGAFRTVGLGRGVVRKVRGKK